VRFPIVIKDNSGTALITAPDCYLTKLPEIEFGKDVGTRIWEFTCGHLIYVMAGSQNLYKTYDPQLVSVIVATFPIVGWADGTFVKALRNVDSFTQYVGTKGEEARARQWNLSGKITFTLMQTSASNDMLSALYDQDQMPLPA
jgi:hypothetical protein